MPKASAFLWLLSRTDGWMDEWIGLIPTNHKYNSCIIFKHQELCKRSQKNCKLAWNSWTFKNIPCKVCSCSEVDAWQQKESMTPWGARAKLSTDLFNFNRDYVVIIDYYSSKFCPAIYLIPNLSCSYIIWLFTWLLCDTESQMLWFLIKDCDRVCNN